jgi:hypothetical protein
MFFLSCLWFVVCGLWFVVSSGQSVLVEIGESLVHLLPVPADGGGDRPTQPVMVL